MEVTERYVFALDDASRAGEARRTATTLATRLGASREDVGRIALIVTEATTNVVKHAQAGQLLLYGSRDEGAWSVGMVAVDRGPGMRDLAACLEDGMSTAGTPGTGLGAIRRLATTFDAYTSPGGTVVFAEIDGATPARRRSRASFSVGAVRVPHPGEEVCGDDVAVMPMGEDRCMVLVVDGLGHGLGAAAAAEEATRLFRAHPASGPEAVMSLLHDGLRGTRGAAAGRRRRRPPHPDRALRRRRQHRRVPARRRPQPGDDLASRHARAPDASRAGVPLPVARAGRSSCCTPTACRRAGISPAIRGSWAAIPW
jgi:anti-sigma regulatory factor (Ser/Thr protein kinase)